jgi:SAM-dependent methyltransferase
VDDKGYLLDNRRREAGDRFAALSDLFDPVSFGHLERLGIAEGWRCWEVGAGGPGVASWMAQRAGPGRVLATDIDTSWLRHDAGFEVRRHDVATERPPEGPFDVIHARLLLIHLPNRETVLSALVDALRPGGWLLLEEADPGLQPLLCPDETGPAERLANRLRSGFRTLMAGRGVDLAYGRTLPRRLRAAGLCDVGADAYFPITSPACLTLERATVEHIRASLVAAGLATDADIDQHLANIGAETLDLATAPLISAWGRRPSA